MTDTILAIPAAVAERLEAGAARMAPFTPASLLDPQVCRELRATLREQAGPDALDSTLDRLRARLETSPYAIVVRGLRFDPGDHLLVGLTTSLGDVVYPRHRPDVTAVNLVAPRTDFTTARWGVNNETLHTDSTRWRVPNRYTCLQCVRADDEGGGATRLMSVEHLLEGVRHRDPGLLAFLRSEPVPWGLDHGEDGEILWQPVVSGRSIRWARFSIGTSADDRALVELTRPCERRLGAFLHLLATYPETATVALRRDDLLIIDNHLALHARAKVRDPSSSRRLLRRVRIGASVTDGGPA